MQSYWMFKNAIKNGWQGDEFDFLTEGLGDTINEKREALFVRMVALYKTLECEEVRMSQYAADMFGFIDCSNFYWPEREEYPRGKDGPRLLRFTCMNCYVCADCPKDIIMFKKGNGYWETLKLHNIGA